MHIVGCNFVCMCILPLYNSHTLKYLWNHKVAHQRVQWGDQPNTFSLLKALAKAETDTELWGSLID